MVQEAERLAARWRTNHIKAEARRRRAQDFAGKLAARIGRADPQVRTILGFGSTFEAWRQYRQDSDIDLALCGGDWIHITQSLQRVRGVFFPNRQIF